MTRDTFDTIQVDIADVLADSRAALLATQRQRQYADLNRRALRLHVAEVELKAYLRDQRRRERQEAAAAELDEWGQRQLSKSAAYRQAIAAAIAAKSGQATGLKRPTGLK